MSFTASIILRYLRSRRGFTGVVTGFSVAGILLGVAALIVVMCVMAGFRDELLSRMLGMNGHATLVTSTMEDTTVNNLANQLEELPAITEAKPVIQGQVMISVRGRASGALVRGMEPSKFPSLVKGEKHIVAGGLEQLTQQRTVAIGEDMAKTLGLEVGDAMTLLSPDGAHTPFGFVPRIIQVKVGLIFDTGMQAYDGGLVLAPIPLAQSIFKLGKTVTALELRVENPIEVELIRESVLDKAGQYARLTTWQESNRQFFAALKVERVTMFIILSLIVLVAAFNIITGQIMLVGDKVADIAILRTMGATRRDIMRIFLINGLLLGGIGTFGGFISGLLIVLNLKSIVGALENFTGSKIFSGDVYPVDTIPAVLVWQDIFAVLGMSLVLTLLASFYPAWRASVQEPVEGLRHG
ncbi:MAG: lipoprotein-releasing ABC transporter permease subunit [Alphaproteobacteria bacterium]|nr:lipoprotein-releasing ABC transporter permease subunit [Alphaproteobacteria bacterium]MDD9920250.1 lipoprotein-releasing ABC transporter permease subunit [Alphaproteobacteria bacterium]